jgi:hypothetical protein
VSISARQKFLIGGALLAVWFMWPGSHELTANCEPESIFSSMRAMLFGKVFWEQQLDAVRTKAKAADNWDTTMATVDSSLKESLDKSRAELERLYAQHPDLAPSPAERRAQQLRDLADAIEAQDVATRTSLAKHAESEKYRTCENIIVEKLRASNAN